MTVAKPSEPGSMRLAIGTRLRLETGVRRGAASVAENGSYVGARSAVCKQGEHVQEAR